MSDNTNNPLNFLQGMWNQMGFQLPGMVTPTLDEGELDKQIKDLKSVENWLRMNLSMLQMTIQNLEMQKSALGTFRTMSAHFTAPETNAPRSETGFNPFFQAAQASPASPPESAPGDATAAASTDEAALAKAAMWPWEMMNDINTKMQEQLAEAAKSATAKAVGKTTAKAKAGAAKKAAAKKPAGKAATKSRARKNA